MTPRDESRSAIVAASLAALSMGAITLLLGLVATAPLLIAPLSGRTRFARGHIVYFLACGIGFFLPAVLHIIAGINIRQRKSWAAVMGAAVAIVHGLAGLGVVVGAVVAMTQVGWFMSIPAAAGLVLLGFAIYTASAFWRAMRFLGEGAPPITSAFEPIVRE